MKFKTINANDLVHMMTFPENVDVRHTVIICELSEDSRWLVSVFVSKAEKYALQVFYIGDDKVATLKNETEGFNTYIEGRAIGRGIARYWDSVKADPSVSLEPTLQGMRDYLLPEDLHAAGMELFVERGSKQIISVFMVGAQGNYERFPMTVGNMTLPVPAHLMIAIEQINDRITKKVGSYARLKRPLKTGDLVYADPSVPAYATVWILGKSKDKLLPLPLDPTFDIVKWLAVSVEDHRKGLEHCYKNGLYGHTGTFKHMNS